MKRIYCVQYTNYITFEEDDVPEDWKNDLGYATVAEAAFFQGQVGEWKVSNLTAEDGRDVELSRTIPFDIDDQDMDVTLSRILEEEE